MKKIALKLSLLLFAVVLFVACNKDTISTPVITPQAKVRVVNVSEGLDSLNLYADGAKLTNSPIKYNAFSQFYLVDAGNRTLKMEANGATSISSSIFPLVGDSSYTLYAFRDTGSAIVSKGNFYIENTTAPTAGNARVTFLHLSPYAPAVDLEFVNSGGVASSSSQFTNTTYKSAAQTSTFAAKSYDVKVKLAGTTNIVASISLTLESGKIYTVFARGNPKNANSFGVTVTTL